MRAHVAALGLGVGGLVLDVPVWTLDADALVAVVLVVGVLGVHGAWRNRVVAVAAAGARAWGRHLAGAWLLSVRLAVVVWVAGWAVLGARWTWRWHGGTDAVGLIGGTLDDCGVNDMAAVVGGVGWNADFWEVWSEEGDEGTADVGAEGGADGFGADKWHPVT